MALAVRLIDEANAQDPTKISWSGELWPKEMLHAEMVIGWVNRLCPDASEALLLAARAHHIRRWTIPRSSYPRGRKAYLRWRTALHAFHAAEAGDILRQCGYEDETVRRVEDLIFKRRLGRDPEVQVLEDALCLVFLQTQFRAVVPTLEPPTLANVVRKTWQKMSEAARQLVPELSLDQHDLELLTDLLTQGKAGSGVSAVH